MSFFLKIGVFSAFYLAVTMGLLRADTTTDLSQKLALIDQKRAGRQTDTQGLEQECLGLLSNVGSAEDSGLVYAEIVLIYSKNGLTQPKKTASYCELALRYPLADTMTVRIYVAWASAISKFYGGDTYVIANTDLRIEIARICMNGLKQIMSYNLPKTAPDISTLPSVPRVNWRGSRDDPAYEELMRERMAAIEKRKEYFRQTYLIRNRDALIDKLVRIGKVDSGTKKAIEQLAHDTLVNADDVNEVLSLIHKKLSGD